jgi:hypothetical protein
MNVFDFVMKEIGDATTLYNSNKDEAHDKLISIEHNITTATFLSYADKERLLSAVEMARNLMNNGLMQNVLDDIEVADRYKSKRVNEFAKKCEIYNRDLHRKTQHMLQVIAGLRQSINQQTP